MWSLGDHGHRIDTDILLDTIPGRQRQTAPWDQELVRSGGYHLVTFSTSGVLEMAKMVSVAAGNEDDSYDGHSIPSLQGEAALIHSRMGGRC